jgi:hypothetical protein
MSDTAADDTQRARHKLAVLEAQKAALISDTESKVFQHNKSMELDLALADNSVFELFMLERNRELAELDVEIAEAKAASGEAARTGLEAPMRPPGLLGPKQFAQLTEDELHDEMMGAEPGSNYFEWAKAELEHRDRKRHAGTEQSVHSPRPASPAKEFSRKVFVVHGHDEGARETVARFLERLGFEAIILHEQASRGRTVIEKVEAHGDVGFAVVLLTPDDEGCVKGGTAKPRARQNVLLELGY